MSVLTAAAAGGAGGAGGDLRLRRRRLPRWSLPATAVGCGLVVLTLFALTPLQGRVDYLVSTCACYVFAQTMLSTVVEGGRAARDRLAATLAMTALAMAVLALVAVLGFTVAKGIRRLDVTFLTHSMFGVADGDSGGGAYHAIIGTLEQVGIASAISVPFGLLVSIYLVEYAHGGRFGRVVSTTVDVATGLPSIVAGLFVYSLWILSMGHGPSGFAGALSLTILMVPVVVRSTEEILRLVPDSLREASLALGITRWRTIVSIVLPTALSGITTGVMLAIARVTGETAPLLLTVFGNPAINNDPFNGPQEGLPQFVFAQAGLPTQTSIDRAWAGALTLILIVMLLNLFARLVVWRSAARRR
ncbi:MAG TPA: phosphate ABC transporter permease PstA [Mycobacteriales bacterium]